MVHRTPIVVRFSELDPYRHVNHAVYVVYFEEGRSRALREIGLDLGKLQREGWQMVLTELAVRYRAPALLGDELTVESWVAEIGGASARWGQRVVRGAEVCAEASVRLGMTDESGRVRRMPKSFVEALTPLLAEAPPPGAQR